MNILEKIKKYRELDALNYSFLKSVLNGNPKREDKKSRVLDIGSLVDCLLTTPKDFDDLFVVIENMPGKKPCQIIDHIFEVADDLPDFQLTELAGIDKDFLFDLLDVYEYHLGTYKDSRDEARISRFMNEARNYHSERLAKKNKVIVDQAMKELAKTVADSIRTSRFTKIFFEELPEELVVHNQVVIVANVSGRKGKCLIDMLIENPTHNSIVLDNGLVFPPHSVCPIDIKTIGDYTNRFVRNMWKYRYDIQGSYYSKLLSKWVEANKPGYTVIDFMFIVESTKYIGNPTIYILSETDRVIGEWGARRLGDTYVPTVNTMRDLVSIMNDMTLDVLGWQQAIKLYEWHNEHDEWEHTREMVENNGLLYTEQYK